MSEWLYGKLVLAIIEVFSPSMCQRMLSTPIPQGLSAAKQDLGELLVKVEGEAAQGSAEH